MKNPRPKIAWEIVKQRLARGQAELAGAVAVDRAQLSQVFRQRAQRLAQRGQLDSVQSERTPVLTFRTGNERFGIELSHVTQAFPRLSITPVPCAGNHLLGVANLQGKVRSVIDLGRLMDLPAGNLAGGYIVLMRTGDTSVGLCVDSVEDVRHLELDKLSVIDEASPDRLSGLVKGTTDDCISVLDPEGLMACIKQKRDLEIPATKT